MVSRQSKAGIGKSLGILPLLLLAAAAWVVVLGGLAAVRHTAGLSGATFDTAFGWFVFAFVGFTLFVVFLHAIDTALGGLSLGSMATTALVAISAVLCMIETRDFNTYKNSAGLTGEAHKGLITAFAGFLALSVFLTALLIATGINEDALTRKSQKGQQVAYKDSRPTGTSAPAVGAGTGTGGVTEV